MLKTQSGEIIIFSDNLDYMSSLCEILSEFGYFAAGFTSWQEALEVLEKKSFDIFLMDIETPDVDYIHFLKHAANIDPHLISIIVTKQGRIQNALNAMKAGAFDYLLKPFNLEVLFKTLSKAIAVRNLKKEKDIYCSIFEHSVEGIYLIRPDQKCIAANLALSRIFGYQSPEELIANFNSIRYKTCVEPHRYEEFLRLIQKEDVISGFESQICCNNSDIKWISENALAIRDKDGNILYYRGTIEDITEKKCAEETLRDSELRFRMCAERMAQNTDEFLSIIDDICESYKELEDLFGCFVKAIVNTFDEKSIWFSGHSERVALYTEKIARETGLDELEIKKLRLAALLHDIGRICIFEPGIEKPAKLSDEEFEIIKQHPVHGATILGRMQQMNDIIPFIKYHHERMDGKGYPEGLKGDEIPLGARILHVAESFDSMTSARPHRPAPGKEYAFSELRRCNGSQFDPQIAEIALRVL
jgi:PAS domain S-box-containing protein/putative nucleotidyltransferase with HDIG domain